MNIVENTNCEIQFKSNNNLNQKDNTTKDKSQIDPKLTVCEKEIPNGSLISHGENMVFETRKSLDGIKSEE